MTAHREAARLPWTEPGVQADSSVARPLTCAFGQRGPAVLDESSAVLSTESTAAYPSDLTDETVGAAGAGVQRTGDKQPGFRPIRHAWRVEVAHGRLGRSRRLAKSFENTTASATGWLQVACIATTLRHLSQDGSRPARMRRAA